jgi:hypothetical protein
VKEKFQMEQNRTDSEMSQICSDILTYVAEHPDAGDTVEGIVQWWLLQQRIKHRESQVKDALAKLVAKGLMLERQGRDGRIRYRINRQKQKEIGAIISQKADSKTNMGHE